MCVNIKLVWRSLQNTKHCFPFSFLPSVLFTFEIFIVTTFCWDSCTTARSNSMFVWGRRVSWLISSHFKTDNYRLNHLFIYSFVPSFLTFCWLVEKCYDSHSYLEEHVASSVCWTGTQTWHWNSSHLWCFSAVMDLWRQPLHFNFSNNVIKRWSLRSKTGDTKWPDTISGLLPCRLFSSVFTGGKSLVFQTIPFVFRLRCEILTISQQR